MSRTDLTRRTLLGGTVAGSLAMAMPAPLIAAQASPEPTRSIRTTHGRVRGLQTGAVSQFLGIPYGADTAATRFQPPDAVKPWRGVRDCYQLGPKTPQGQINIDRVVGRMSRDAKAFPIVMAVGAVTNANVPESEDCLVLNVITPEVSSRKKRPVMVWLHGGGFAMGSGMDPMTDGSRIAERGDVVYVSLNHRLNALGYLYLGALHDDFADSGNAGMLDIVLALEWVRDNIEAFGGDPGNVTIFGQSGGGAKVSTVLGMVPAKGLFHKAIAMSGPIVTLVEKDDAAEIAERTLASLGVAKGDVHALLQMDFKTIIKAASAVKLPAKDGIGLARRNLAPMVDGRTIPAHPFHPVATELSRDVPLMIGFTKDESTLFMAGDLELGNMSEENARKRFTEIMGDKSADAFTRYSQAYAELDPSYWVSTLITDRMFGINSVVQADRKAEQGGAPVYSYRVDFQPPVADGILRAPHGTDVPLVFGTKVPAAFVGSGRAVDVLSDRLMQAWINFAHTGNPSQEGLAWPQYGTEDRLTMIFDAPSHVASFPDRITQEFWSP